MDRQVRRLGAAFLVLFVVLFAQINYVQVFGAERLANNSANAKRQLIAEYAVDRGEIVASDGQTVLARSRKSPGELRYQRLYPQGPLYSTVTGFYSFVYGKTGLESAYNDYLTGDAAELLPQTLADQVLGRPKRGGTVVTTIDPALQQAAASALGSQEGGVVAIEPSTGYVRVLYSKPNYDPNLLAAQDTAKVTAAWKRLTSAPDNPMLSRAISELYPPGSTFKTVTSSAALSDGYGPDSQWPNPHILDLPQTTATIQNFGGEYCPGGSQITLIEALTVSCNVVFGEVGLKVGADKLAAQAHAFGFAPDTTSGDVPFDIPWQEGVFPAASYFADRLPEVAISAIGQAQDLANPMQMALVASAIANHGVELRPRLVEQIRDQDGRVVKTFGPEMYGQPISSRVAADLTQMMISVVEHGTGTAAQIPGLTIAGKTGTAQHGTGSENPHAWFVCFAPKLDLAVAVVVPDGGNLGSEATGGQVAAPIAKAVLEAALRG
ncbi:MAG: peptidoglycan D,D-transpeptidase FtsI family protein [Actinomycetota bacterium]